MKKFQSKNFFKSSMYALNGLRLAFKSERNFRKHLVIAAFTLSVAIFLKVNIIEFCLVLFASIQVLIFELINSVIEYVIDAYYRGRWAKLAKLSKDIAAAAVLTSAILSATIATLIFANRIWILYLQ